MLFTIALLVLAYSFAGKTIDNLVDRIMDVDWEKKSGSDPLIQYVNN